MKVHASRAWTIRACYWIGHLAVTRMQISIEWFRLFLFFPIMKNCLIALVLLFSWTSNSLAQIVDYGSFFRGQTLYHKGNYSLMNNKYGEAAYAFAEGTNYHPDNYEGLGICFELGFGDDADKETALDCYKEGAKKGSANCKRQLSRIKKSGFWAATKENRRRYINKLKAKYNYNSGGGGNSGNGGFSGGVPYGGMPGNFGSGSSSGSTYTTCSGCGGSGNCTGCGGSGKYWVDSGMYTGSGSRTQVNCGSCGGSGRCRVCYGKGRL